MKKYLFLVLLVFSSVWAEGHNPPILTTTAIIEVYDQENFEGIVLIERGKAIPGGKVEYGETVEVAV